MEPRSLRCLAVVYSGWAQAHRSSRATHTGLRAPCRYETYSAQQPFGTARRLAALITILLLAIQLPVANGQTPVSESILDSLSDQQLIDLYIVATQESLRDSIVDQSALIEPQKSLLQVGYSYTTQEDAGLRFTTHTFPEFLIRHRLTERMEMRLAWGGATFDRLEDEVTGQSDTDSTVLNPSFGLRFRLWRQRGFAPQTSISASTPVDFDSNAGFMSRLNPQVSAGYSWILGSRWLIAGSTGAVWTRDFNSSGQEDRFLDLQQSLSLDWLLTDRSSLYLQWTALLPEGSRIDEIGHSLGPGASFPVGRSMQVDLVTAFGLGDGAPDFATQVFWSRRF